MDISKSLEDTKSRAFDFVKNLEPLEDSALVVGLYGDLGAGKTTFMKYVAEAFGIENTIQSPTFVIQKIYNLKDKQFKNLVHIDAYRIEEEKETSALKWQETVSNPQNIVFVEWPERISGVIGAHKKIHFSHGENENERHISF